MKQMVTSLLSLVLVAVCTGVSLKGYQPPTYEVTQPVEATVQEEKTETKKKEKKKTTKTPVATKTNTSLPTVSKTEDPDGYKDGTYYGTGTGFGGTVKVKVVIKKGKISSIDVVSHADGGSYMAKASSLLDKIISKQSTNVDTVSGATYSSAGLIKAVRNALSQAAVKDKKDSEKTEKEDEKKEETLTGKFPYPDGVYYGTAEGYLDDITVAIVIENKTITTILVTKAGDDDTFLAKAKAVIDKVLKKQTTKVDTVSGATYSSNGILNAIKNALSEAKKAAAGKKEENTDSTTENTTTDTTEENNGSTDNSTEQNTSAIEGTTEAGSDGTTEVVTKYNDGTYDMVVPCSPDEDYDFEAYSLHLKVQIKGDKIVAITNVWGDGDEDNDKYVKRAVEGTSSITGVVAQITSKGLPEGIDTVSRATCSSKSIIEACEKALEEALR